MLEELGLADQPTILVLNKVDRVTDRSFLDVLKAHHDESIAISAANGEGLDRLEQAVREVLNERALDAEVETGVGNGRVLSYLAQHANIQEPDLRRGQGPAPVPTPPPLPRLPQRARRPGPDQRRTDLRLSTREVFRGPFIGPRKIDLPVQRSGYPFQRPMANESWLIGESEWVGRAPESPRIPDPSTMSHLP